MGQSNSSSSTESSEILRTEEEEKTFNNEFEFIRVGRDAHLGDYAIMREIKSGRLVCVKEKLFSKRQDMIQFYHALKAVVAQETFDLDEANSNSHQSNKMGLQLMNQKENMQNNPNGNKSGAQLGISNGSKVQKGKLNLVSQTVVQKKSKRRNSEGLNFCGGDSRIDDDDEQIDSRITCIPIAKIPHEGFLRIIRVTKAHFGDSFRVLYAIEYPCKTLADQINSRMNEKECWDFLEQITSVLKIYEGRGQYHGDLSTSSIFVISDSSQNKVFKIVDRQLLGISSHFERLSQKQEKLTKSMCPEQLRELSAGRLESSEWEKSDIFSVGCVLVSLVAGQTNWEQSVFQDGYQFNEQVFKQFIQFLIQSNQFFSYNFWNLLNSMIATDPKLRPDFNELQRIIKQQKSLPSQPVGSYPLMDASRSQSSLYAQQQPQLLLSNRNNQLQPQVYQLISNAPRSISQQGYQNKNQATVLKTPLINHTQFPNAMSIIHQISPLQSSIDQNIPLRIEPPGLPWNKRALSIKQNIQGVTQQQYYQNMSVQQYPDQNALQQQQYQQTSLDINPGIIVKSSSRDNIHSYQTPVQKKFNQILLNEKSTHRDEIPLTQRQQQQQSQAPLSSRYVYSNSNYMNTNLGLIPELNNNNNNNPKDNVLRLVTFKDENESRGKQQNEIIGAKEQQQQNINGTTAIPQSIQLLKPLDANNSRTESNNIPTQFTTNDNSKFNYDISTQNSSRTAEIIKNLTGQQRQNQSIQETKPQVSTHIYKGVESGITYTMVKNDNNNNINNNQAQQRGRVQEDDRSRYSQNCQNRGKDSDIKHQQENVLQEQQKHLRTASEGAMSKRLNSSRNYGEQKQDRRITHSPHGLAPSKLVGLQKYERQDEEGQDQGEESVYDNKQDQGSIYQTTNNLAFYENHQKGMSNLKLRNQIILHGNNNSYQQAEEMQGTEREEVPYQGRVKESEQNKSNFSRSDLDSVLRKESQTGLFGNQDNHLKQLRQIGKSEQDQYQLNIQNDSHQLGMYRNPSVSNFKNEQAGISSVNNGWRIQDKRYFSVGKADSAANSNPISSRMALDSYRIAAVGNPSPAHELIDSSILHSRKNLFKKRYPGMEQSQGKVEYDSQQKSYLQQSSTDGYETGQQQYQQQRQQPSTEILTAPIDEVQALSMFTHSGGSISSRRFQLAKKNAAERQKNILRDIQDEEFDGVVIQKSSSSCRLSEDDPIPPVVVIAQQHNFVKVQDYLSQRNSKRKEKGNEVEEEGQEEVLKERVLERYEDGAYYEGEHLKGLRHGKGKFVYADGAKYEGEWFEGSMTGYGLLYYRNGGLAYEGHWKGDKFHGRGVLYNHSTQAEKSENNKASMLPESFCFDKLNYNQKSDMKSKEINYADFGSLGDDWISFDGEFIADEKNGYGTYFFEGNSKFSGNFVADTVDGVGTFTFGNGAPPLIGEWRNNILVQVFSLPTHGNH